APQVSASANPSTILAGHSTQLQAAVTGSEPLTVEWFEGSRGDATRLVGTGLTISVSPSASTSYWVNATNDCGSASAPGSVTVAATCLPATIAQQPASSAIVAGGTATLSFAAGGTPPFTIQWYAGSVGDTSSPISGETNSSISVSPAQTTSYWAHVQNGCG